MSRIAERFEVKAASPKPKPAGGKSPSQAEAEVAKGIAAFFKKLAPVRQQLQTVAGTLDGLLTEGRRLEETAFMFDSAQFAKFSDRLLELEAAVDSLMEVEAAVAAIR